MMPKENRLAKVRDFNLLMNQGRWINGRFLDLKVLELGKAAEFLPKKIDIDNFIKQLRLAITVGIKVSKSAVKRNRLKRQIREVLGLLLKAGKIKSGFYLLMVARKDALEKNYAEISQEIELLLKKGRLI
jgi:ribonuclease P protein component